ncbi:mandelate racemase/muconate lactonizing enzyme family protein [Thermodesulfobacteriota bacterium]
MKIAEAEAISIDIPIKAPLRVSGGVNLYFAKDIIVKITDEKGNIGYGEGAPRVRITGETRKECLSFLNDELFPNLKGEEITIENISSVLDVFPGHHAAKAPVDVAVYDILSRRMGVPLYQFLGGSVRTKLPVARSVSLDRPDVMTKEAQGLISEGIRRIKLKVGVNRDQDIETVRTVREVVGKNIDINIDANQGWQVNEAIDILREMEPYGILFCEQPVQKDDIDGLKEIREKTGVKIMADESADAPEKVRELVSKQAVDCVNIKLEKCGGITPAVQISSICGSGGIPCQLGDAVTGGLNTAAGIHFACANANVHYFEFGCGPFMRVRDFTDVDQYYSEGVIRIIDEKGIGIHMDIDSVRI